MANAASYNRKGAHTFVMTPLDKFNSRKPVQLRDLKDADTAYIDEVIKILEDESKERGEECVIGVWGKRYATEFRTEGFGLYTKTEAEELIEEARRGGLTTPFFSGYKGRKFLEELKHRILNRPLQ